MTTSYNWARTPETDEAFLTVPEGQYVIKKQLAGPHLYRAYFNDLPTRLSGHTVEIVMERVIEELKGEDTPKAHSQGGFST